MHHAIRTFMATLLASALLLTSAACGDRAEPSATNDSPKGVITVAASINQWGSLASEIGGSDVKVTSILSSTSADAHDFEPTSSDLTTLSKAEIVVTNGAGYDTWATKARGPESTLVSAAQIVGASDGDNPHLWFSKDARSGMAEELANTFSKARPDRRQSFAKRLKAWQKREKKLDRTMSDFADSHGSATYAATESVAYYLMSDMGITDITPTGYAHANGGEVAPADLQEFQKLIEDRKASVLINNMQETSDATNMLTGTAGKSDVPVVDVSEQMPERYATLLEWISALTSEVIKAVDHETACAAEASDDEACDDSSSDDTGSDESQVPSNEGQTDPGK